MNRSVQFGLPVLAIALLAAAAAVPCVAQDSHPAPEVSTAAGDQKGVAGDAHSQSLRAQDASGKTEQDSRAVTSKSTSSARDAIDARIAPPSHGERNRAAHVRPINVPSPRNVLTRRTPGIGAPMPAIHNTVGVIGQHSVAGVTTPGALMLPKFGQRAGRASVKPIKINNGALNGTGFSQHASAAAVGGPAPAVGGISGSSFRPKHAARP
jgi:hypothetical protein